MRVEASLIVAGYLSQKISVTNTGLPLHPKRTMLEERVGRRGVPLFDAVLGLEHELIC